MFKYATISLCLLLVLCTSCNDAFNTTIDVDLPPHELKLGAYAFVNASRGGGLGSVTRTFPIDTFNINQASTIEDAEMEISSDLGIANFEYDPHSFNNFYVLEDGSMSMPIGTELALSVFSPKYDTEIKTTQVVPQEVLPHSLKFIEDAGLNLDGDERSAIDVTIQDPPGQNFYEVVVYIQDTYYPDTGFPTYTESIDPVAVDSYDYNALLISDDSFDGEEREIRFSFYRWNLSDGDPYDRVKLRWRNVTEDYYLFQRTLLNYEENRDNPFASPAQVHSNFEDGFGIFGVYVQNDLSMTE